jgi:hypothetical protein
MFLDYLTLQDHWIWAEGNLKANGSLLIGEAIRLIVPVASIELLQCIKVITEIVLIFPIC